MVESKEEPLKGTRMSCMTVPIAIIVMVTLLVSMAVWSGKNQNKAITEFTEAAPTPLPKLRYELAEVTEVNNRLNAFINDIHGYRKTEIKLTARDINLLLDTNPNVAELKDLYRIAEITDAGVETRICWTMNTLSFTKKRYLNGALLLKPVKLDWRLAARIEEVNADVGEIPEGFKRNLGLDFPLEIVPNPSDYKQVLIKINEVKIEGTQIVLSSDPAP